jgi:hypothetical protein
VGAARASTPPVTGAEKTWLVLAAVMPMLAVAYTVALLALGHSHHRSGITVIPILAMALGGANPTVQFVRLRQRRVPTQGAPIDTAKGRLLVSAPSIIFGLVLALLLVVAPSAPSAMRP